MHRIDTPTAQVDKFGPGKNGFTNGDPSTGRRATDLNSDLWDAVQEEICTVIENAGLTLDKTQHDQLYEAIVGLITKAVPDALLRKNNLSDLLDRVAARTNLGLKGGAVKDVQTSAYDTTANLLTMAGAFGWGVTNGTALLASIYDIKCGACYSALGAASDNPTTGVPANSANSRFGVYACSIYTNQFWAILFSRDQIYVGLVDTSKKTVGWIQLYNTAFKPTATDVGAYSKSESDSRFTPAGQAYTKSESDSKYNLKNTASKAANGWQKDGTTGLIIQFGHGGYTKNSRVTFPIAFPNACIGPVGNDSGAGVVGVSLGAFDKTGFTMYSEQDSVSLSWIAIGY